MRTKKYNFAMREVNDNTDNNNVKMFLEFKKMHKWRSFFNSFDARVYFDHIFVPTKDKRFCSVFVFYRGMSDAICDPVLYLLSEGLNISWIYPLQFHASTYYGEENP